jgi:hypothetical protein
VRARCTRSLALLAHHLFRKSYAILCECVPVWIVLGVAVALEPLTDTERHAAPRLSYDASPASAATLSHGTANVPAAPQRSAPVIAQPLTAEKAALMLMLGVRQAMAFPLPA